ncbi:hypothetical protein [Abiotrophia defectiva]|uniref:hypothetical protein n=1 Tax=Abiotrophia defectiva TaxID=46125 RepID=UPI0028E47FAF|nr:hypothetical protein [Abiotrophia defectiva]
MNPYQDYVQDWQVQAPDYPSQALLQVACDLYQQQEDRLRQLEGQLDGSMWSPKDWQN